MKKGFTFLEILIAVGALSLFILIAASKLTDVRDTAKVAKVQNDLSSIRIALENFYTATGTYPDLVSEGVKDDLNLAKGMDRNEKKISFSKVLGEETMPKTPSYGEVEAKNNIYNIQDFSEGNMTGGWNYNYEYFTGEIHANLSNNAFGQMINWSEE